MLICSFGKSVDYSKTFRITTMKRAISTRRFGILLAIGVPLLSTVAFGQTAMFSVKALPILPGYTQAVAICGHLAKRYAHSSRRRSWRNSKLCEKHQQCGSGGRQPPDLYRKSGRYLE